MNSKFFLMKPGQTLIHVDERPVATTVLRTELLSEGLAIVTASASFDSNGNRTSAISFYATCSGVPTSPATASADFPQEVLLECPPGNFDISNG